MSFRGVIEIIGALQLVSTCVLAVYAVAAWRRKRPESKIRPHTHSVPQTLKLLSDLQQLSSPSPSWKLRSPLAKAQEELWRQGELLRRGWTPDRSSASGVTEPEKVFLRSHAIAPESANPASGLTPSSPATYPPDSSRRPLSSEIGRAHV